MQVTATFRGEIHLPDAADFASAAHKAVVKTANEAFEKSQRIVPVDTGHLRGSGRVVDDLAPGTARIEYTADYAAYVHERPLNYRNGQWKYLETAMNDTPLEKGMKSELDAITGG